MTIARTDLSVDDIRWDLQPPHDVAPDDLAAECCDGYKALAIQALAALARATARHRQQRERIAALVGELRTLRAFLAETDRAA